MRFNRSSLSLLLILFAVVACGGNGGGGGGDDDDHASDAAPLPAQCNPGTHQCAFGGDEAGPLGDVACPAGYDCTFQCDMLGCGAIDCSAGGACTILCKEQGCGDITCGAGACDITCMGTTQACGAVVCGSGSCRVLDDGLSGPATGPIDCRESCACDVDCSGATGCPSMRCPEREGDACTSDNTSTGTCTSSVTPACQSC